MEDEKVLLNIKRRDNNVVAAFNEGYMLGEEYAKQLYNKESK